MTTPSRALASCAIATVVLLSGCSESAPDSAGQAPIGSVALSGTDPAICDHFASQPIRPDAPVTPVVVDRTGSARILDLSPALAPVMAQIQSAGAVIQPIGVNGTGVTPTVGTPIALDPAPNKTSRNSDQERSAALGCVQGWLSTPATLPVGDNTDLLAALAAASRQQPSNIVVVSDGVHSTSDLNLADPSVDPQAASDRVRANGLVIALPGVQVDWFNLAETTPPLSEPHRRTVTDFWSAIFGGDLHLHTRTGTDAGK
ncbi:MAG: hypothetical protein V7697_28895 [Rhodococcus erythropolis]